ncbi:transposase [Streptomyces sp. NBC_00076]|uniref:IS110 family transposase n=1 Tax=Streptomyces sp. NBC_00076 TaxID=2975642 RepID=UPI00325631A7
MYLPKGNGTGSQASTYPSVTYLSVHSSSSRTEFVTCGPPRSEGSCGADLPQVNAASCVGQSRTWEPFPTDPAGYEQLLDWLRSHGEVLAVGIEGTGAYGAGLARFLTTQGVTVIEVDRPDRKARRDNGKSDPVDAYAAATAVLSGRASGIPKTRNGIVEAIRTLRVARSSAVKARTQTLNQIRARIITAPAGVEKLRGLATGDLIDTLDRSRPASRPRAAVGPGHRRRLGDVAPLADLAVPAYRLLPFSLGQTLTFACLLGEQPGAVVEVTHGRFGSLIHAPHVSDLGRRAAARPRSPAADTAAGSVGAAPAGRPRGGSSAHRGSSGAGLANLHG